MSKNYKYYLGEIRVWFCVAGSLHNYNQQAKGLFMASNAFRHLFSPLFPTSKVWWYIIDRYFLNELKHNLKAN